MAKNKKIISSARKNPFKNKGFYFANMSGKQKDLKKNGVN
jgi:hypothetical protein